MQVMIKLSWKTAMEGSTHCPLKTPHFPVTQRFISPWQTMLIPGSLGSGIPGSKHQFLDQTSTLFSTGQSQENPVLGLDLPHPLGSAGCQKPCMSESLVVRVPGCQNPWLPLPDHLLHSPHKSLGSRKVGEP